MASIVYDRAAGTATLVRPDGQTLVVAIGEEDAAAEGFFEPPAPPVPEAVTARQARLALLGTGLLATVEQALAALPDIEGEVARIEWEYALEIRRDSPLIAALAPALGLTANQVDDLFRAAKGL